MYDQEIKSVVGKHAPLLSREITIRPNTEWYTEDLRNAKRMCRKAERRMQKSNLTVDRQNFKQLCNKTNELIVRRKREYFSNKIFESEHDQKQLYRLTNSLLGNKRENILPSHANDRTLANDFGKFFLGKIDTIHDNLRASISLCSADGDALRADIRFNGVSLTSFVPATPEEVSKIVSASPSKLCELDPVPTHALKTCLNSLIPTITNIINKSFSESSVVPLCKTAVVKPLLKKPTLDREVFKNNRPISNLPFLSKILEKVVASRLVSHRNEWST